MKNEGNGNNVNNCFKDKNCHLLACCCLIADWLPMVVMAMMALMMAIMTMIMAMMAMTAIMSKDKNCHLLACCCLMAGWLPGTNWNWGCDGCSDA